MILITMNQFEKMKIVRKFLDKDKPRVEFILNKIDDF